MTFCLGMRVEEGLVAIADTRITSGNEVITARKVSTYEMDGGGFFLMTAGLRSVRDKTLTYFEDELEHNAEKTHDKLYRLVNAFAAHLRNVAEEDRAALEKAGAAFNITTLIGGQLSGDSEHRLFLIYSEGNWVEITKSTPYHIIGERGYGKPVLDRTLKYTDPIQFALKVGCLSFDSTRISASDVDFPVDVVVYMAGTRELVEHRYEREELSQISEWWQEHLRGLVHQLPSEWIADIAAKLERIDRSHR